MNAILSILDLYTKKNRIKCHICLLLKSIKSSLNKCAYSRMCKCACVCKKPNRRRQSDFV